MVRASLMHEELLCCPQLPSRSNSVGEEWRVGIQFGRETRERKREGSRQQCSSNNSSRPTLLSSRGE